jgi:hypothetical protein
MVIILDKPVSLGDISSDTFPHCFVTNFYVNGPAVMVQVAYEFGTMKAPSAENQSGWNPCPAFLNKQFSLQGEQLVPFFSTQGESGSSLWDEVEKAIYVEIQKQDPRTAGTLGLGYDPNATSTASTSSVATDSSGSSGTTDSSASSTSSTDSTATASTASGNTSATPAAP